MILAQVVLAQQGRIEGIRSRFADGNTFAEIVLAVAVVLVGLLVLWTVLSGIQSRQKRSVRSPSRLFRSIVRELPLNGQQRSFLTRIARDLRLEHPTVLVLSPQVFRNQANRWMSVTGNVNATTQKRITELCSNMFPVRRTESPASQSFAQLQPVSPRCSRR